MKVLAANLNMLMERHKESNKRLAAVCAVSHATIGRIRNAQHAATLSTLEAIAAHYRLEPWQLLIEDLDPSNPPQLAFPSRAERELYERFKAFISQR